MQNVFYPMIANWLSPMLEFWSRTFSDREFFYTKLYPICRTSALEQFEMSKRSIYLFSWKIRWNFFTFSFFFEIAKGVNFIIYCVLENENGLTTLISMLIGEKSESFEIWRN